MMARWAGKAGLLLALCFLLRKGAGDLYQAAPVSLGLCAHVQLRKPLDRVISSYEFAIDVAARHVHLPDDDPVFNVREPAGLCTACMQQGCPAAQL